MSIGNIYATRLTLKLLEIVDETPQTCREIKKNLIKDINLDLNENERLNLLRRIRSKLNYLHSIGELKREEHRHKTKKITFYKFYK